jgi:2-succinyl-6-hydroxy-2,4-cyclohexadiene-1-carboxylate synthase
MVLSFRFREGRLCYSTNGTHNGPKLLCLHGFLGSKKDFKPILEQLSSEFHCLSVDLPGHGKTKIDQASGYGMAAIAQGLIQLIQELDFAPCYLVGYSMGGRLALYLACCFPQYFSGVLLESTSPGLATELERAERQKKDEALAVSLETDIWPNFVKQWYNQPLFSTLKSHSSFETLLQSRYDNCPFELARSLRGMGTGVQPSLWAALSGLKLPLTLVVGGLDFKFMALNQAMISCCPSARLVTVPTGHVVHFEAPALFGDILHRSALKKTLG